jgi:hypothetical protein
MDSLDQLLNQKPKAVHQEKEKELKGEKQIKNEEQTGENK